jgi:hypothetical protein
MDRQAVRDLVTEIFEEEALLLGGLVAVHPVTDDVVWRLVRGLDGLRQRFLRRLDEAAPARSGRPSPAPRAEPHPAIEDFLRSIREEAEVAGR